MSVSEFALGTTMFGAIDLYQMHRYSMPTRTIEADEIVPPGTEVDPADHHTGPPPALVRPELRRRAHWSA